MNCEVKCLISQQISTTKHKNIFSKVTGRKKISLLPTVIATSSRQSQFAFNLRKTFCECQNLFMDNPTLRHCLEKCTSESVPSESSL